MFESLDMPVKFIIAFLAVLSLIGGAAFLVRRFGASALSAAAGGRGRQPRLAVIDHAAVDGRRRLVLIRRDNVEHLIMIGGPSDVVIEPNIVRAIPTTPAREVAPARVPDPLPRAVPLADGGAWPLQPDPPPRPQRAAPPPPPPPPQVEPEIDWPDEAAPRAAEDESQAGLDDEPHPVAEREPRAALEREPRVSLEREPRMAPEREPRVTADREPRVAATRPARAAPENAPRGQNPERLAGLAADLSRSFMDPDAPPPPPRRTAEQRRPPAPVSESDEQNLAEMAQRLETVLHRPRQPAGQAAEPAVAPPPPRAAEPPPRAEPAPSRAEANPAPKPATKPAAKPAAKPAFDNLEQEMASLLGRPSGKS
jgi:flagellar protein FliO/FliZ